MDWKLSELVPYPLAGILLFKTCETGGDRGMFILHIIPKKLKGVYV
jgi:hypothetical protein